MSRSIKVSWKKVRSSLIKIAWYYFLKQMWFISACFHIYNIIDHYQKRKLPDRHNAILGIIIQLQKGQSL